jgi:hypothetical protein
MNIKSRIKRLEKSSKAGGCNCPDIIVIRPGGDNPKLCPRCLNGETTLVLPSLEVAPGNAGILSHAGKVYAGFNFDLV